MDTQGKQPNKQSIHAVHNGTTVGVLSPSSSPLLSSAAIDAAREAALLASIAQHGARGPVAVATSTTVNPDSLVATEAAAAAPTAFVASDIGRLPRRVRRKVRWLIASGRVPEACAVALGALASAARVRDSTPHHVSADSDLPYIRVNNHLPCARANKLGSAGTNGPRCCDPVAAPRSSGPGGLENELGSRGEALPDARGSHELLERTRVKQPLGAVSPGLAASPCVSHYSATGSSAALPVGTLKYPPGLQRISPPEIADGHLADAAPSGRQMGSGGFDSMSDLERATGGLAAPATVAYLGEWRPLGARKLGFVHSPPEASHASLTLAKVNGETPAASALSVPAVAAALASACFLVHPDSKCTGSVTDKRSRLINTKPCSEKFRAANGVVATATCVGDLPVVVLATSGQRVLVTFTNVRCVPHFSYTLLSAKQMCREQCIGTSTLPPDIISVNSLFLPDCAGGHQFQFEGGCEIPTLRAVSIADFLPSRHAGVASHVGGASAVHPTPAPAARQSSAAATLERMLAVFLAPAPRTNRLPAASPFSSVALRGVTPASAAPSCVGGW